MASRINQLAQASGLGLYEDVAYGRINDIFLNVSINNYTGMTSIIAFVRRNNGVDITEIESFFEKKKNKYPNVRISYDGQALSLAIPKPEIETVSEIIKELTLFLRSRGYRSACAMCENKDGLELIVKDGAVMEACMECRNKLESTVNDTLSQSSDSGSYFKGAIGAVLGGIVGIIPWVLIDVLGFFAAFCGLIMAYLSCKGYRLMKGRKGKGMVFIIAAVLIVFTFFAVTLSQTFDIYNAYHGDKSGLSVLSLFGAELVMPFTNETFYFGEYFLTPDVSAIWTNIGLGFFFAAAGSAIFLKNMFKPTSGKSEAIKLLKQNEGLPAGDTVPKK